MMLAAKRKPLLDPEALQIETIDNDPDYRALLEELAGLEQRRKGTEARRRQARARAGGAKPGRSVVDRAKDLMRGGEIPGFDMQAELAACDQEDGILKPAIAELTARLDDLRGDLSLVVCRKVSQQHDAALVAALRAMEDLGNAFDTAAEIRARVIAGGYQVLEQVLPPIIAQGFAALGNPAHTGKSNAWFYKDQLEKRGILR